MYILFMGFHRYLYILILTFTFGHSTFAMDVDDFTPEGKRANSQTTQGQELAASPKRGKSVEYEGEARDSARLLFSNDIKQVCDGVWAGQGVASSGERIFYGLEVIDKSNEWYWRNYYKCVDRMADGCYKWLESEKQWVVQGYMQLAALFSTPEERKKPIYAEWYKWSGFTQTEFIQYVRKLYQAGFKKGSIKLDHLDSLTGPALVDNLSATEDRVSSQCVAYISKVPVTGRFPFKNVPVESITIKIFNEIFGNLVMSVNVNNLFSYSDSYMNIGIIRNPAILIDGGYRNVSLPLHGFTAAVAQIYFFAKLYMEVSPLKPMQDILLTNLSPDDAFIQHHIDPYIDVHGIFYNFEVCNCPWHYFIIEKHKNSRFFFPSFPASIEDPIPNFVNVCKGYFDDSSDNYEDADPSITFYIKINALARYYK